MNSKELDTLGKVRAGANGANGAPRGASLAVLSTHRVPAHLARRFHQIFTGVTAEILDPENIRPIEWAVLAAVTDHPRLEQGRVALSLGIDATSTSQMVERLVDTGLIERKVDPSDRRARVLEPTAAGLQLRRRLRPALVAAQRQVMAALSDQEQATLIDLLVRILESNDAYARPGNGRRRPQAKHGSKAALTSAMPRPPHNLKGA